MFPRRVATAAMSQASIKQLRSFCHFCRATELTCQTSRFVAENARALQVTVDTPHGEHVVDQAIFPHVRSVYLPHARLAVAGDVWATPWRRCNSGFVLWTRFRCTLETTSFDSAGSAKPTATAVSPMGEDTSVEVAPSSWYRFCGISDRGLHALLFFPVKAVAHTEFGERLPFFVYGTLRSGYANHKNFMREHKRIGDTWRTVAHMALYVGKWPYLIESPPTGVTGQQVTGELYDVEREADVQLLDELEEGYRKDLILVVDDTGARRVALAYFGETVSFDSPQALRYIPGGDFKKDFPPDKDPWN